MDYTNNNTETNMDNNPEKLYDCLKRAGAYDYIMSLDKKEYTYVNKWFDKTGIEFSGGERQKLAIARCLYKDGDFVVLDEPTSALDPMAEAERGRASNTATTQIIESNTFCSFTILLASLVINYFVLNTSTELPIAIASP